MKIVLLMCFKNTTAYAFVLFMHGVQNLLMKKVEIAEESSPQKKLGLKFSVFYVKFFYKLQETVQ